MSDMFFKNLSIPKPDYNLNINSGTHGEQTGKMMIEMEKVINDNQLVIPENILLSEPVGYLDFIKLESSSMKIITDSGGIQKGAYILKKPCITIRPETEWIETVKESWNVLVNVDSDDFINTIERFNPSQEQSDVFGKNVAQKMFDKILEITRG